MKSKLFAIQIILNSLSRFLALLFISKLLVINTKEAYFYSLSMSLIPIISMNIRQFIYSSNINKKKLVNFTHNQYFVIIILILIFEIIKVSFLFISSLKVAIIPLQIAFSLLLSETIYCNHIIKNYKYKSIVYYSLISSQYLLSFYFLFQYNINWCYGFIFPPVLFSSLLIIKNNNFILLSSLQKSKNKIEKLLSLFFIKERIKLIICLYPFAITNFIIIFILGLIDKKEIAPALTIFYSFVGLSIFINGNLYEYLVPNLRNKDLNINKYINLKYLSLFAFGTIMASFISLYIYPSIFLRSEIDLIFDSQVLLIISMFSMAICLSFNQWLETILIMKGNKRYIAIVNTILIVLIIPSIFLFVKGINQLLIIISIISSLRFLLYLARFKSIISQN